MVEDNKVVGKNNNSGQKLAILKKLKYHQNLAKSQNSKNYQNLAKSRKSNYHPKLSRSKKAILDKSKILVNLIVTTNAGTIKYFTLKARVSFT